MKVKEIIEELKKYPQDLEVYVPSHNTENDYCMTFSVSRMELINNDENSDSENIEDDYIDAIVIDEQ